VGTRQTPGALSGQRGAGAAPQHRSGRKLIELNWPTSPEGPQNLCPARVSSRQSPSWALWPRGTMAARLSATVSPLSPERTQRERHSVAPCQTGAISALFLGSRTLAHFGARHVCLAARDEQDEEEEEAKREATDKEKGARLGDSSLLGGFCEKWAMEGERVGPKKGPISCSCSAQPLAENSLSGCLVAAVLQWALTLLNRRNSLWGQRDFTKETWPNSLAKSPCVMIKLCHDK